ncbi:MAG: hypothetical protein ACK5IQ_00035 [Bacteroidales bacterium]
MRGAFPNEESVLALITSVAIKKSEKERLSEEFRYMLPDTLIWALPTFPAKAGDYSSINIIH